MSIIGTNAATTNVNGILVAGLRATDIIRVSKTVSGTYQAWSHWSSDGLATTPDIAWGNEFRVTRSDTTEEQYWNDTRAATAAASQALAVARPLYLTGYTSYKFWIFDTPSTDNRGGWSIDVTRL